MTNNLDIINIATLIIALIVAIVGHEYMHGRVAYYYGDNTAKNLGRLTINPINHVDIVGTIIVPIILFFTAGFVFGWAKPVPIKTRTVLENGGLTGAILVSLAGIIYNLLLAFICLFLAKNFSFGGNEVIISLISKLFIVNLFLGLFNLYPFPPLDGSRALAYILAGIGFINAANFLLDNDKYFMLALIVIIISPFSQYFFLPIRYGLNLVLG